MNEERVTKSDVLDALKFYKDDADQRYLTNASVITDTATTSANGLMSTADKAKLDGLSNYSLPTASSSTLGGVKIGSNITNSSGTISISKDNVTDALGYTPPTTNTTYNVVTTSANGLMSSADKVKLDYLYNNAVTSYQSGLNNVSLMSAADNLIAVIPIAEIDEEYFNIPSNTLTANRTSLTVGIDGDIVDIKSRISREELPYHPPTFEVVGPAWVTLDSENSFYTDNGTEYVQRILTVAPPTGTALSTYTATAEITIPYKVLNDGVVSDATVSDDVTITVTVTASAPEPPTPTPEPE